jgi:hypothetical protein
MELSLSIKLQLNMESIGTKSRKGCQELSEVSMGKNTVPSTIRESQRESYLTMDGS